MRSFTILMLTLRDKKHPDFVSGKKVKSGSLTNIKIYLYHPYQSSIIHIFPRSRVDTLPCSAQAHLIVLTGSWPKLSPPESSILWMWHPDTLQIKLPRTKKTVQLTIAATYTKQTKRLLPPGRSILDHLWNLVPIWFNIEMNHMIHIILSD